MPYRCAIKFCGLRTEEDVDLAVALGVERIGFVLTASPRQVDEETCRALRERIPPGVVVHGLFTTEPPEEVRRLMASCRLDVAQVHGRETDKEYWAALDGLPVLRAYRVRGPQTVETIRLDGQPTFLLDAYVSGAYGGTGESFDWDLARRAGACGRVMLAGGLRSETVGAAIAAARPWAVDVSGGIERERGVKDPRRMDAFVQAVRAAERELNESDESHTRKELSS